MNTSSPNFVFILCNDIGRSELSVNDNQMLITYDDSNLSTDADLRSGETCNKTLYVENTTFEFYGELLPFADPLDDMEFDDSKLDGMAYYHILMISDAFVRNCTVLNARFRNLGSAFMVLRYLMDDKRSLKYFATITRNEKVDIVRTPHHRRHQDHSLCSSFRKISSNSLKLN